MGVLNLVRIARSLGVGIGRRGDKLVFRNPRRAAREVRLLAAHKEEVFAILDREQAGPWPTETWGPLLVEHFEIRTLDDLDRIPAVDGGEARR